MVNFLANLRHNYWLYGEMKAHFPKNYYSADAYFLSTVVH